MLLNAMVRPGIAALAGLLCLAGCTGTDDDTTGSQSPTPSAVGPTPTPTGTSATTPTPVSCTDDLDGDTYVSSGCRGGDDCDDSNASIYPGAAEGAAPTPGGALEGDLYDNDCDGTTDEDTTWHDDDGDGFSELEGDCNDIAPAIAPDKDELCGDFTDNNCDGNTDNRDGDGDGYIDVSCTNGTDCADTRADIYPGASEGPDSNGDGTAEADSDDNDCDGTIDEDTNLSDDDGDTYSELLGDCDDGDTLVYPGAIERFDDKDQNCDSDLQWGNTAKAAPASVVDYLSGQAGHSIAGVGDVDGDGYDDLLIGAPQHDLEEASAGAAFLVSGRTTGWDDELSLSEAPILTYGPAENSGGAQAGFSVAGTGDINGDGRPDFAIGAPGWTENSNSAAGAIYIFAGQGVPFEDQVLGEQANYGGANSFGVSANVQFGYSLGGAGPWGGCDVTGDGRSDLIIGGPWNVSTTLIKAQGYLMILPGSPGTLPPAIGVTQLTSYKGANDEALGYAAACGGDFDGAADLGGFFPADVLIAGKGTASNAGIAYMVPGDGTWSSTGPKQGFPVGAVAYTGDSADEWVGHSVANLGDVDGDGLADFAIGRRNSAPGKGLGYIVYGGASPGGSVEGTSTLRITGADTDACPCVVKGVADFNGDGFRDVVLSAAGAAGAQGEEGAGKIYIFLGQAGGFGAVGSSLATSTAAWSFTGEYAGDAFGASITPAGDLNGDGLADFAVGAPRYDADLGSGAQTDTGKVYIFFGFQT